MIKLKCYFYLSHKRRNSRGLEPIFCRVYTCSTDRKDFSTGIFLSPNEWDEKKGFPKENSKYNQARLTIIQDRIFACIAECERIGVICPFEVIERYKDLDKRNLSDVNQIADEYFSTVRPCAETIQKTKRTIERFIQFANNPSIRHVLPETIQGFENELLNKYGFNQSHVNKCLGDLKAVFRYAKHRNYLTINYFEIYRMKRLKKRALIQLSEPELLKLSTFRFASACLSRVRDLFLFQCYTGMSYSDLAHFSREMIVTEKGQVYLKGERQKTKETFFLPYTAEIEAIAERYDFKLPVITNQRYNVYIKQVAELIGIERKRITTHVARRTFAQIQIDKGYSAEAVAKMMGHADFKMTQKHYGRIGENRIMNEFTTNQAQQAQNLLRQYGNPVLA